MKPYFTDEIDLASGTVVKREVDSTWLHQELLASAERMQTGVADNLDIYDTVHNPTGAFWHQDVQAAFYGLTGASRSYASLAEKREAILSAADALAKTYG